MAYLPIDRHGLIGDLHTAGLVAQDGRLVWLPWPHVDSPSIFAALLDDRRGGVWLLAPKNVQRTTQAYHDADAVLITTFETATGTAELWDWMSPCDGDAPSHDLCRVLRCVEGEIFVQGEFAPRPDYARATASLREYGDGFSFDAPGCTLFLKSSHTWAGDGSTAMLETVLRTGEEVRCVLCSGDNTLTLANIDDDLAATQRYWQTWIAQCSYDGPYLAAVQRSVITLKLLTYAPSGTIVAAPTTSLPEVIGGERNWDYRYTWLRDAALTLDAFCTAGFHEEEGAFFNWLDQLAQQQDTPLQIMYGVDGRATLPEQHLDHLEGYRCSKPVRIGNAAYEQRQLDVYGSVISAAFAYARHQNELTRQQWIALRDEVDYVCAHWHEPDQGIWEMRGPPRHFTYSKLMCWVALEHGIGLAEHAGWEFDRERWIATRDAIRESILNNAWNEEAGAFTQSYGSAILDASVLILPQIGFLPPDDPRLRSTVDAIKRHLSDGACVHRYRMDDHLPGEEGAFLLCSFWMVDALTLMGELDEAQARFEALLSYTSAHGLLPEEIEPAHGTALGNYPQAFSHIGLINSASYLHQALSKR